LPEYSAWSVAARGIRQAGAAPQQDTQKQIAAPFGAAIVKKARSGQPVWTRLPRCVLTSR
jgi:hypothetical protein